MIKKSNTIDITRHWGERYTPSPIRLEDGKAIFLIKGSLLSNDSNFDELEFVIESDEIKPRSIKVRVERGKVSLIKTVVVSKQ
ncbi:MAG: hypothetical protein HON90_04775 [Halobacteriovoraceae bacterium]|nr:hypothetical protein [Halobacteriovoraceae bacterium]